MEPITKQRIDCIVYEQLLENIRNGVWKGGDKLPSEPELCEMLNVSRDSVRSALSKLKVIGLIEVKSGKGSYVLGAEELFDFSEINFTLEMTKKEFQEIIVLREMLEEKALELIIANRETVDFRHFSNAYQGMIDASNALDVEKYTIQDAKFHLALIAAAGNDRLTQIAQIFKDDIFHFLHESNKFLLRSPDDKEKQREYFSDSMVYHKELYNAIINGSKESVNIGKRLFTRNFARLNYYYDNKDSNPNKE